MPDPKKQPAQQAPDTLSMEEALGVQPDASGQGGASGEASTASPSLLSQTLHGNAPWQRSIDKAAETEPVTGVKSALNDLGAGTTRIIASPVAHPLETIKGLGETLAAGFGNDSARYDLTRKMVEPFLRNPSGETVAAIPQAVMALAGGKEATSAEPPSNSIAGYLRPTPSSAIVSPGEMAARNLSAAILPPTRDAANFIKAAPIEVPNIVSYAKRTGNPLNTQLEFSKAALGNADEVRNFYKNQILGPNDVQVRTTGSGFGRRLGEGPDTFANLSEVDDRISKLNRQLDAPTLNADDARRALASKSELEMEARHLRDLLHSELARRTGVSEADIANVRQRVGRSYELANDTDAAVTSRMQSAGRTEQQTPFSFGHVTRDLINRVTGGPVASGDRAFRKVIKDFPGEPQSLPQIQQPFVRQIPDRMDQLVAQIRRSRQQ